MKEIRLHGRGGQGIVTAAEIIATAAFLEDKHVQSFPTFGPERRGAPVVAFVRIDDCPIRVRMSIYTPDCVVVLDPQLSRQPVVTEGLKSDGIAVLNTKEAQVPTQASNGRVVSVDATGIALDIIGRPITNTVMVGAFCAATGWVEIGSVLKGIKRKLPEAISEKNMKAASLAYERTKLQGVA